ncbi:hypothetical protein M3Y96_01092000 [Aphelenchoides besseyi]|nr:hypothetical protein M3Y96_01092000 [Aphelenchoides besseyi]
MSDQLLPLRGERVVQSSSQDRLPELRTAMRTILILALFVGIGIFETSGREHGQTILLANPDSIHILLGEEATIDYIYKQTLNGSLTVNLNTSSELSLDVNHLAFNNTRKQQKIKVKGVAVTGRSFVDVKDCADKTCPFNSQDVYVTVTVSHSVIIKYLIDVVGWIYFTAWTISFWPQIILNFQRRSVVGLNFDFIVLNILGFTCYSIYNVFLYFLPNVQDEYFHEFPRGSIPVTIPDLAFALHAVFASLLTGIQCLIYERANQRISYTCIGWTVVLLLFAFGSLIAAWAHALNWFGFITYLSYVKMAVSLSKYTPQAITNFRRRSTVGWSIGNVLLDFTGGCFSILQMVLIGSNTNDWSGFAGNPVKFGLGLVSIIFDILFMVQHFILYRHTDSYEIRTNDDNTDESIRTSTSPSSNMSKRKVLLMGKSGAGKTSMRSIIFANYIARDCSRLGPTMEVEHAHVKFLGNMVLHLWDCGGQETFMENYMTAQKDQIFKNVQVLIYVFDVESREVDKDYRNYQSCLEALIQNSPTAKVFCLVHKMDLIPEESREKVFNDKRKDIIQISDSVSTRHRSEIALECYRSSIWDESLYKAWSSVIHELIGNIKTMEAKLKQFAEIMDAYEVLLFEKATFLVIAETQRGSHDDIHRFEKVSNIIKQFKLSCSRMGSQFESIEIRNTNYSVFIDTFTNNTYIMVILPDGNVSSTATIMNIRNARKHFEKLDIEHSNSPLNLHDFLPSTITEIATDVVQNCQYVVLVGTLANRIYAHSPKHVKSSRFPVIVVWLLFLFTCLIDGSVSEHTIFYRLFISGLTLLSLIYNQTRSNYVEISDQNETSSTQPDGSAQFTDFNYNHARFPKLSSMMPTESNKTDYADWLDDDLDEPQLAEFGAEKKRIRELTPFSELSVRLNSLNLRRTKPLVDIFATDTSTNQPSSMLSVAALQPSQISNKPFASKRQSSNFVNNIDLRVDKPKWPRNFFSTSFIASSTPVDCSPNTSDHQLRFRADRPTIKLSPTAVAQSFRSLPRPTANKSRYSLCRNLVFCSLTVIIISIVIVAFQTIRSIAKVDE